MAVARREVSAIADSLRPVTIVNVGYRSTNYWVVAAGRSRLPLDLGWPGTLGKLRANLERLDVPLDEIRYALATHYHLDHAGLAQELKQAGVPLLVMDVQVAAISVMKRWTKPQDHFVDITTHDNVVIPCTCSSSRCSRPPPSRHARPGCRSCRSGSRPDRIGTDNSGSGRETRSW
jgi:glyoxylase-like metal-dependent hydrolase (beta-lactamase superfamily II)